MKTTLRFVRVLSALFAAGWAVAAQAANNLTVTPSTLFYGATASSLTVTVTITYTSSLSALDYTMTTPTGAGWSVPSVTGTNVPPTIPDPADRGSGGLGFIYTTPPSSGTATFTYTLNYPAGMTGSKVLSYTANLTDEVTSVASPISGSVTLNPIPLPVVNLTGLASQTVTQGQNAVFTVTPDGSAPYTYVWKKGTTTLTDTGNVSGSSSATLTIASAQPADEGSYTVTVSNAAPSSVTSSAVTLTVNTPPTITTQPTNQATVVGVPATFSVVASGKPTSFTYQWKKGGVDIANATSASYTITSPQLTDNATTYSVVVSNTIGSPATSNVVTLTVDPTPVVPTINTHPQSRTVVAGTNVTFTVAATGVPSTYTYVWKKGTTTVANGGSISGATTSSLQLASVTSADAGSYTVIVSNTTGSSAPSTPAVLTVNPILATTVAVPTKALTVGRLVVQPFIPVVATSGTGTPGYTYSVTPLPAGLSIDAATGAITGTPTTAVAAADYTVTVTDAGSATSSKPFNLTVNAPVAATQAVASTTLTASTAAVPFTPVTATGGTGSLTYAINPALPTGLVISSTTGAISGTATAGSGPTTYTVTVTDTLGSTDSKTFSLLVNGPMGTTQMIASNALTVGAVAVSFIPVSAGGGTAPYVYGIAPALPGGLTINTGTGAISGTPTTASAATVYTVTATDSNNTPSSKTFTLTVNAAPTSTQTATSRALTAGTAVVPFTMMSATGGTSPLTYTINPSLSSGLTLNPSTGSVSGLPAAAVTMTTYTVTATDAAGATTSKTFDLTINVAPSVTGTPISSKALTAGTAAISFTPLTITGGTTPYTYSSNPALPSGLTINAANGAISGTPAAATALANFTIAGTDAVGAQLTQTLALVVNAAVTATQAVASRTLTAGTAAVPFIPVTPGGGTPGPGYSFAITPGLPTGLTLNVATGEITGTPGAASATTTYTVTVTDSVGAAATRTFTLTVNGPLAATQAMASRTLTAGTAAVAFTPVTAGGGTTPYVFSVSPSLPSGLTISAATGAITGTAAAASGPTTYTVTIADSLSASVNESFSLTVNPALTSVQAVPTKALTKDTVIMPFTPVTTAGGTAPIGLAVSPALPAGLTLNPATGEITGTPTVASAAATYTVTATDAVGAITSKTFGLTVNAVLAAVSGQTISAKALTAGTAAIAFTPLPLAGGTVPYAYMVNPALPAGLALDATTGAITGIPTAATASANYTITGTDSVGAMVNQTLALVINPTLVAVQSVPNTALLVSTAATTFTPVTYTGGTAPFVYSINPALPTGLSMSTSTGAITGTPTATSAAVTYTATVTDAAGAVVSQTFTIRVDRAPAITTQPTASASYLVGNPLTLSVVATGSPAPTYQWKKGGVDLAGKTDAQLVFASLQLTDAGAYTVVVTNSAGFVTSSVTSNPVTLVIYLPPAITTQPVAQTVVAGASATFSVVATGDPAPTYQWRRNGLNISGATGASYTINPATFNAGGLFTVQILNPGGSVISDAVALTVNPVAPVITSPTTANGVVGRNFLYQIMAGTSQATYSATGLPAGLTLNTTTGVISGVPTTATGGTPASVSVTATNVTGTDTKTVAVTIQSPPPVITSAAATSGRVGTALAFTVVATNTPTGFSATGLPPGLSIDAATGAISGTPTASGAYNASITATNGTGSITSQLFFGIEPPPNVPAFTGATNIAGVQGTAFTFTPAFANGPFTGFSATGLPAGLAINATTGAITGTATVTGTFTVNVTATNAGGSTTVAFSLTVNPAPSAPIISSASTATATVGTLFNFQLTSTGTPAASSYAATVLPASGLSLDAATGIISGTPTAPTTLRLQVSATNSVGSGPNAALVIVINPAANAPVVTSSPVVQGRVGDVLAGVSIAATNTPTGFVITSGTLPTGLALDANTGAITGTPTQVGQRRVAFAATNATGQGLGMEVLFNILPALTMPVITSNGTAAGQVGQPFQYIITATNTPTSFNATGLPAGLALNGAVISGIPTVATTTAISVTLTATNGSGTSNPKTLLLSIAPAPATPEITSALTANGRVGSSFTYQMTASEGATSFVAIDLPAGLTVNSTTGAISGTPTSSDVFSVTLRAANAAGLGAPSTLRINVAPPLAAPSITSAPAASGKVGVAFTYTIVATPTPITGYGLTGTLPLGLALNTSTGIISGRPAAAGVVTVQLTATGAGGTSVPQSLVLNILPPDGVPVITSPNFVPATVGANFSYQITAIIMPGATAFPASPFPATHALDAVNLPAGLAVNPSNGLIQGQPTVAGRFVATIYGTSAAGNGPMRELLIDVQPAPTAPVITSAADAAAQAGNAFSYQIVAANNPTSYEVLDAPSWMTVDSQTGQINGTPPQPRTVFVQLYASNSAGSSNPVRLKISIEPSPNAPVISSSRTASGQIGVALSYQISANRSPTSYVVSGLPAGLSASSTTGLISGTPTASGRFEVTLSAVNSSGASAPVTLVITIAPNRQLVVPGT